MNCITFHEHVCEAILQEKTSARKIFHAMREAGIRGVVLDYNRLKREPRWERWFRKYRIAVSSMYGHFDYGYADPSEQERLMREFIDTAQRLNCPQVLCIPGFFQKDRELDRTEVFQNMCAGVRRMVEYAGKAGITVSMEDFDGEDALFRTSEELMQFHDAVPGLGIAYDSGNFAYTGEDELDALERLKDHIVYVHLKDRSSTPTDGASATMQTGRVVYPCAVGTGMIRMEEILRRLKAIGYDGDLAMEHFGSGHQLDDMKQSARWIQEVWAR